MRNRDGNEKLKMFTDDLEFEIEEYADHVRGFGYPASIVALGRRNDETFPNFEKILFLMVTWIDEDRKRDELFVAPLCRTIMAPYSIEYSCQITPNGRIIKVDKELNREHSLYANEWITTVAKQIFENESLLAAAEAFLDGLTEESQLIRLNSNVTLLGGGID